MKTLQDSMREITTKKEPDLMILAYTLRHLADQIEGYKAEKTNMYYGAHCCFAMYGNDLENLKAFILKYGCDRDRRLVMNNEEYKDSFGIEDYV